MTPVFLSPPLSLCLPLQVSMANVTYEFACIGRMIECYKWLFEVDDEEEARDRVRDGEGGRGGRGKRGEKGRERGEEEERGERVGVREGGKGEWRDLENKIFRGTNRYSLLAGDGSGKEADFASLREEE